MTPDKNTKLDHVYTKPRFNSPNSTFIKPVGAVWYAVADPPLGNAGVFGIAAAELVTRYFMNLVWLTVLFVAIVQTVWMTVAMPNVRNT